MFFYKLNLVEYMRYTVPMFLVTIPFGNRVLCDVKEWRFRNAFDMVTGVKA